MINAKPLAFTKEEVVSSTTFIHQVENGTIFYRDGTSLWVRHNDQKIKVEMDGGFIYSIVAAQGHALYYGSNWRRKIYKAELKPSGTIEMQFIREMVEGESIHPGGLMSFIENAQVYAYRMCDDPMQDRIHLEGIKVQLLAVCDLAGIHENFTILKHLDIDPDEPTLSPISKNCTMMSCYRGLGRRFMEFHSQVQTHAEYNSPWGSPTIVKREYIYLTNGKSLFVVNPADHTLKQPLNFVDVSSFYIAGVHEGILTGRGKCEKTGKFYLMTAQLPSDFVINPQIDRVRCDGFIRTDLLGIEHSEPSNKAAPQIHEEKAHLLGKNPPNFTSKFSNEFAVRNIVGSGGFGIVFEANHLVDNGTYAVKRISVESSETVEKALVEARAMAKLEHEGIVRYYTSWIEEPPEGWQALVDAEILEKFPSARIPANHNSQKSIFLYIQLQLCQYSLEEWLMRNEPRILTRMKTWFKQIVTAVAYIHEQSLIHRDLKPSNILFADSDSLKICDLGIVTSRTLDDGHEVACTYTNAGTPLYMAPEQSQYRYTSKVDVFTLGLIFIELCVEMSERERREIFGAIKCELPTNILQEHPSTLKFVEWLTLVDDELRPTCQDILRHEFLA